MRNVSFLSLQPWWFGDLIGIRATINDPGDFIAKFFLNIAQSFRATAIFHGVVKKRADRFSFLRTVLKRDSGDAKNMRDERNPRFLARLITMRPGRINQRFLKLPGKLHLDFRV